MRSLLAGSALALTSLCALAEPASAAPKILICFADFSANAAASIAANINQGNIFAAIDTLDCAKSTPSVATLKTYDGVFLWDVSQYADKVALGNNLADYVDAGGGVVQGMYNFFTSFGMNWNLQGRWDTGKYNCITPMSQQPGTLKAQPNDANSPLVLNVKTLVAQNTGSGGLMNGATSVWDYSNGAPAIATCTPGGHLRVDTNFYPVPANWTGDGYQIIKNALLAVSGGLSPIKGLPSPALLPDTGTGATSAPLTITFTNIGMVPQTATSIGLTGPAATEFGIVKQPNFPVTLMPMGTFTVDVNFSPATMGTRTAKLSIAIAGMGVAPSEVALSGKAIGATIKIAPNPAVIGGTQIGKSVSANLTISNSGGGKIIIGSIATGNPAFTITAGPDLPVAISGGGSFQIAVTFTPTANGITKDTLTLTTNDITTPTLTVPISGYAGAPAIATDAGSIAFGSINVSAMSQPQIITVSNVGFSDLTVTSIKLVGNNVGDFVLDAKMLPGTIAAQSASPVTVTFAPTTMGARTSQLVIVSNDANTPTKVVNLFGTGTTATASVAPASLDFGSVRVGSTGMSQDVTISGMGSGKVQVLAMTFGGMDGSQFIQAAGTMPPFLIAANGSAVVSFACKPSTVGALTATISVVTDVGAQMVAPVKCNAISPKVTVTPNLIDFGPVALTTSSKPIVVTIANNGTADLTLTDISIGGGDSSDFSSTDIPMVFPLVLQPASSATFKVVFTPSNATQENAEIDFTTDDTLLPKGKIIMTGLGAVAGLSVSPQLVDCGTVLSGTSSAKVPVTITNSGMIPLKLTSVTLVGPSANYFQLDRDISKLSPVVLPARSTTAINVSFQPLAGGVINASLQVVAEGLAMPVTVGVRGTGYAPSVKFGLPGGALVLDLGNVPLGMSSSPMSGQVGILNASTGSITIASVTSDNPAFKVDSSMTNLTLAPQGQTSVVVTFTPAVVGAGKAMLSLKLQGGVAPIAVLGAQGVGTQAMTPPPMAGGCTMGARGSSGSPLGLLLMLGAAVLVAVARRGRACR